MFVLYAIGTFLIAGKLTLDSFSAPQESVTPVLGIALQSLLWPLWLPLGLVLWACGAF